MTQVERHLRQGRERAGAATVGELLGVLVADGIIGPPRSDDEVVPGRLIDDGPQQTLIEFTG